ncbi:MAG: adenylate/guanylate cyclase domain-containing protein, partial [Mariprofundaceae bacterium]
MLNWVAHFIERYQKWFGWPLIVTMSLTAFALAFVQPYFLEQIELKTLDQRFKARGVIPPNKRVVILAVDDDSLTSVGRWPWPRDRIGSLIDRVLGEYGAAAMGMDIVFSESQANPVNESLRLLRRSGKAPDEIANWLETHHEIGDLDASFEQVLKKYHDRLVLGYFFYPQGAEVPLLARADLAQESSLLQPSAMTVELASKRVAGVPHVAAVEGNLPMLTEAADTAGFFNFFPDADGTVRRVPLIVELEGFIYPSLDLQTLRVALGWPELSARIGPLGVDEVRLGEHVIPTDRSGGMLLNHYGPGRTFTHVSAAEVLAGRADPGIFRDAIVLLGVTAVGVYDYRPSPFDSAFPGVEGHAAAISNILNHEEIKRPQMMGVIELFSVLLFSLLCGRLVLRSGPVMQSISIFGIPMLLVLISFWLFAVYGIWVKITYLLFGSLLAAVPTTLLEYVVESRRRMFIHDAFSHYLAPKVVENLSKNPEQLKLGGEEREVSAFFSDIAGFSTFSEKLEPEALVHFLNLYLTAMSDIILAHGGTIDKYEGDAIIAFFGAPVDMPDHATRCVLAALEQQATLSALRLQWAEEGYPKVHIRIGINSGPMVVGNMGTATRMNYTMMGDHVNLAARLEGVNKAYRTPILISRDTYDLVRDEVAARFVDRVRVVGRKKPVDIYQPICRRSDILPEQLEQFRAYEKA